MKGLLLFGSCLNLFVGILGIYSQYSPMFIAMNFAVAFGSALLFLEREDHP